MERLTLDGLAQAINEATGYEGALLQQATYVAAALLADVKGNKQLGDYFASKAEAIECESPLRRQTFDYGQPHWPGWNFGTPATGCVD